METIKGFVGGRLMPPDVGLLVFESDSDGKETGRKFIVECSEATFHDTDGGMLRLKRDDVDALRYLARKHNRTDVRLNEYVEIEGIRISNLFVLGKKYESFSAIRMVLTRNIVGKIKADDEKVLRTKGAFSVGKDGKMKDVMGDIHMHV